MEEIAYIGDISKNDASVLARLASGALRILEFGPGASTQVMRHHASDETQMISTDHNQEWLDHQNGLLSEVGVKGVVQFVNYKSWRQVARSLAPYDLILDDGDDSLRFDFAIGAWDLLAVGGTLLFHDTRRYWEPHCDVQNVCRFIFTKWADIERVDINVDDSNLTAIVKGSRRSYVNWNEVEGRTAHQAGYDPVG